MKIKKSILSVLVAMLVISMLATAVFSAEEEKTKNEFTNEGGYIIKQETDAQGNSKYEELNPETGDRLRTNVETKTTSDGETKILVDVSLKNENAINVKQAKIEVISKSLVIVPLSYAADWSYFADSVLTTPSDDAEFRLTVKKDNEGMVIVDEQISEFATYEQKVLFENMKTSAIQTVEISNEQNAEIEITVNKQVFETAN